jgi:ABC-type transport system substrate-binding protein
MKHAKLLTLLAVLVIASMVLAACPAGEVDTGAVATQVVAAVQTAAPTLQAVATEVAPVVEQAATQVAEAIQPSTEVTATAVAEEEDPCAYGGIIKDIVAVDELTVRFDLCVPDPAFPAKAADTALQILPSEFLERAAGTNELLEQPIGTGPYMLKEWRRGDQMIMEANPNYWGEAPFAQTLVFRWTPEAAQRLLELQAGNVNGIDNPGPDDFEVIEGDANLTLYPRAGTNVFYVGMNNAFPPFDNERVRQAFAMAIDRDRIVENFYPAGSLVATQFMPPSIFGYSEGLDWYEYNPEMAKQILEEEGVYDADGTFNTIISYRDVVRGYLPEPGVVAQDIQAQLAEIGVNAEINVMESGSFLDAADAGQLDGFHLLGWGADYPDATNFLDYHFGRGASKQFGAGFPELWEKLEAAASLASQADRQPIYDEANELIKTLVPMIPVAHGGSATAFQAVCEGAHSSPLTREKMAVIDCGADTLVWMQNGEPVSLYCADETDGETFRACEQINEALLSYEVGTTNVEPALAESFEANEDLTSWTFKLRPGVTFHDGSALDSQDVVTSWVAQWDAASPLHKGRVGDFTYFQAYFLAFKNAPQE